MTPDDLTLLQEFATGGSEPAFAALVERHAGLVHSAALRQTGDAHLAGEVTQAVFIILARKAAKLGQDTILSAWLYRTTRYTASNALKIQRRRQAREQEAYMQSLTENDGSSRQSEATADAWQQLAPLLDDTMDQLSERDRAAVVLRYFENRPWREVADRMQVNEDAAQKRVARALEKLRGLFYKRGVMLTVTLISGAVSANSVQAVPVGLTKTITLAAVSKGAVVTASTLTLVKGALKLMAWSNAKMAVAVGTGILLVAGATTLTVAEIDLTSPVLTQKLPDGSMLTLDGISFGDKHGFGPDGNRNKWQSPGHDELLLEFSLNGPGAAQSRLVNPDFYRQFRLMLRGEKGIEFAEEFLPDAFKADGGQYYGYLGTGIFPRDSHWLWVRVESRNQANRYDDWQPVAEFKFPNPAVPADEHWTATPSPATNTVDDMNFVLDEITVKTVPSFTNDIWNHRVDVPMKVFKNGVLLTNWSAAYFNAQDASGNEGQLLGRHRSLDPRYIWKLDLDFEPDSEFAFDNMATVKISSPSTITTNIAGLPVTLSWDGFRLNANIPTNRTDLALKFVSAVDDAGNPIFSGSGSWNQHNFFKQGFMRRNNGILGINNIKLSAVTFAIVPNVHTTFFTQPRLLTDPGK